MSWRSCTLHEDSATEASRRPDTLAGPEYQESFPNPGIWSEPALASDGTIYVCLDDPYLRSVAPDGQINWILRLGVMGGFTLTVGADGLIYAACDDYSLYVVTPAGEVLGHFDSGGGLSFPVIGSTGTLYVSEVPDSFDSGRIWAISLTACLPEQPLDLHHPADLNGDGFGDLEDISLFSLQWLEDTSTSDILWPTYLISDIDRNLIVDLYDLQILSIYWLMDYSTLW